MTQIDDLYDKLEKAEQERDEWADKWLKDTTELLEENNKLREEIERRKHTTEHREKIIREHGLEIEGLKEELAKRPVDILSIPTEHRELNVELEDDDIYIDPEPPLDQLGKPGHARSKPSKFSPRKIDSECKEKFGVDGEYNPACCRFPKACSPYEN